MLKIFQSPQPISLTDLSEKIGFQAETLILSNLRSKKEIQTSLLKKQNYFLDESVLRASDFWRLLLRRYHPQKRIISADYAKLLISSWLRENSTAFSHNNKVSQNKISENSASTVHQILIQLSPLFLRDQENLPLAEWLETHSDIAVRVGPWFVLVEKLVQKFQEKNLLLLEMVPAYLLNDLELEKKWDRPLWIDLGSELSLGEAEIFQAFSRRIDVRVIEPHPSWKKKYDYLLSPYSYLNSQAAEKAAWSSSAKLKTSVTRKSQETRKLSGRLSEVKNATGLVRQWLDSGVKPHEVAVLASQIETYWPALNSFFEVEGIPSQKNVVAPLISLPSVIRWISTLKSKAKGLSTADLETALFGAGDEAPLKFEKFISIFKNIYSEEDLFRIEDLKNWFLTDVQGSKNITRDQFAILSLRFWSEDPQSKELEAILKELVANTQVGDSFPFVDWVEFIQKIATKKEKHVREGSPGGVEVTQVMSGHDSSVTHRIFLGLVEEDFSSPSQNLFNWQQRQQLVQDLGFQIDHPEQNFRLFQLDWLREMPSQIDVLSLGLTHFDGQLLNPLSQWVHERESSEASALEAERPEACRWDDLQSRSSLEVLKTERHLSEDEITNLTLRLKQDEGVEPETKSMMATQRISPTSLMSYLNCPFIFKSEKIYRLDSLPEIDLDVDPRPQGNLTHRLFEKISTIRPLAEWNEENLGALIEEVKSEQGDYFFEKSFWRAQKKKYLVLAQRFIDFETTWRKNHPKAKDLGHEVQWKFGFDIKGRKFVSLAPDFSIPANPDTLVFTGKIDRIDGDSQGSLVVIDYKSSAGSLRHFFDWIGKNQLQLIFYMWVLEKGFISGFQGTSVGAFYYVFKNFQRDIGMSLDGRDFSLPDEIKKKSIASEGDKEELFGEFEKLLLKTLDEMREGEFQPRPREPEVCENCRWSLLCRAPHLN